jgi:putative MATE family efflux protein
MFPLFFFMMALAASLTVGVGTLVGRAVGEKNRAALANAAPSALLLALVIAAPAVLGGYLFGDRLVRVLAGTEMTDEALGYGLTFFRALLPGLAVMVPVHVLVGILQGQGLTRVIAASMVGSTLVNIVLDPLFIFTLDLGVAGAGLATSLAICSSGAFLLIAALRSRNAVPLGIAPRGVRLSIVSEILRIGLPNFLSMAAMSVSFMVFNKLVSTIGEDAMNAYTLVGRMDQAVLIPTFAVAGATSIMVSQNYGRRQLERVRSIFRANTLLAACIVGLTALVYMVSAPWLFSAFSNVSGVVAAAALQVRWLSLTFVGVSVAIITASTFQATGNPLPAFVLALVRMGFIALPTAFLLMALLGPRMTGIYLALGIGNLAAIPLGLFWVRRHLAKLTFRAVVEPVPAH